MATYILYEIRYNHFKIRSVIWVRNTKLIFGYKIKKTLLGFEIRPLFGYDIRTINLGTI